MKRQNKRKKRLVFVATSAVVAILAAYFIISNFKDQIVFFYSPSDLHAEIIKNNNLSKEIRIGGLVKKYSVDKKSSLIIEFKVTDGAYDIKVRHRGLTPDLFREGQGVVANGFYDNKNKIFLSSELLVKHDENYMPPEVADSIKHQLKK